MAGPSFALKQFLESFHASRADRRYADDFHLGALAQLSGAEWERAERLLLARLQGDDIDDRVAGALAVLGSRKAVAPLRSALDRATGLTRVRVAAAVAKLDATFDPGDILVEAIDTGDFTTRGTAIRELAKSRPARARSLLLDSLTDPNFSVRIGAFDALLEICDLSALRNPPYSPLRAIGSRLLSDLDSVVAGAAAEMHEIVRELDGGKSPLVLGLAEIPKDGALIDRVMASLGRSRSEPPWNHDLDLEALAQLKGDGRRFVECVLLAQLHEGDPRIPRALAAMQSTDAVEPLREALAVASDDQAKRDQTVAIEQALEQLAGDET